MIKLLTFFWQVGILPGGLLEAMQSIETPLVQDAETQLSPLAALTWRYGVQPRPSLPASSVVCHTQEVAQISKLSQDWRPR